MSQTEYEIEIIVNCTSDDTSSQIQLYEDNSINILIQNIILKNEIKINSGVQIEMPKFRYWPGIPIIELEI